MTEPEALDALDQFHARHLILFEGVECPGIQDAFRKWEEEGKGSLHVAKMTNKPGLFEFVSDQVPNWESLAPLKNEEDGIGLLLRTSGTTARPK